MRQFRRADRVRNQMLRDVQSILEQELIANLDAMVTFTEVKLSGDLKYAKVFYSVLGNDRQKAATATYLGKITKRVQAQLGRLLNIKFVPEITFKFDPSVEQGVRIQQLLNSISQDDEKDDEEDS